MATFKIESPDKKNVKLELVDDAGCAVALALPPKEVGLFAASVLNVCRSLPAGDNTPSIEKPADFAVVRTTHLGLAPGPDANAELLILGSGDAQLAVSIGRNSLKRIGEGMIALSASGKPT